jgi:hypothetical protein
MALVAKFEERQLDVRRIHDGVLCGYHALDIKGKRILQLETYGSPQRAMPGKISQSIQLDEEGARTLLAILHRSFPILRASL